MIYYYEWYQRIWGSGSETCFGGFLALVEHIHIELALGNVGGVLHHTLHGRKNKTWSNITVPTDFQIIIIIYTNLTSLLSINVTAMKIFFHPPHHYTIVRIIITTNVTNLHLLTSLVRTLSSTTTPAPCLPSKVRQCQHVPHNKCLTIIRPTTSPLPCSHPGRPWLATGRHPVQLPPGWELQVILGEGHWCAHAGRFWDP